MKFKFVSKRNISIAHPNGAAIFVDKVYTTNSPAIAGFLRKHKEHGNSFSEVVSKEPNAKG